MKEGWKWKLIVAWGLGLLSGTFSANFFLEADKRELLFQEKTVEQVLAGAAEWKGLFLYLLSRRLSLFFFLILVSLTVFGLIALCGSLFSMGFSMALLLCVITMNVGVRGILYYGLLWTPQILCYGPAFWGTVCLCGRLNGSLIPGGGPRGETWQKVLFSHLGPIFLLLLLWILGIGAETWVNPWLLSLFLKKI